MIIKESESNERAFKCLCDNDEYLGSTSIEYIISPHEYPFNFHKEALNIYVVPNLYVKKENQDSFVSI